MNNFVLLVFGLIYTLVIYRGTDKTLKEWTEREEFFIPLRVNPQIELMKKLNITPETYHGIRREHLLGRRR